MVGWKGEILTDEVLSLKTNRVYYSDSFGFYIVDSWYLDYALNEHETTDPD
jgi:hypothetical protein